MATTVIKKEGGVSICGVLFIILITLKVAGLISCSWWWVFAPLWLPLAAVVAFVLFFFMMALIGSWLEK